MLSFSNFIMAFFSSLIKETTTTIKLEKLCFEIIFQLCYNLFITATRIFCLLESGFHFNL